MGRVFSWSQIESRDVPDLSDFGLIVGMIREELLFEKGVYGAILCGSVMKGSHTQRSDIDCLVVYHPGARRDVFNTLARLSLDAGRVHVPLEMIPIDLELIQTSMHHVGFSFASHLARSVRDGGLIRDNPLPLFLLNESKIFVDLCQYIQNKLRFLEKGVSRFGSMSDETYYRFLQKSLEAPVQIARKMLELEGCALSDDSRSSVKDLYGLIASLEEYDLFCRVVSLDEVYTTELSDILEMGTKEDYDYVISQIEEIAWDTLEFTRWIALRLAKPRSP